MKTIALVILLSSAAFGAAEPQIETTFLHAKHIATIQRMIDKDLGIVCYIITNQIQAGDTISCVKLPEPDKKNDSAPAPVH
jgi:hypothetical protein